MSHEEAHERLTKGLARHPVPIMLLARLAVDRRWHGQGVGKALLKDAMQRTLQAADIAGIRAFAVPAKDEEARRFYEKFDFIASPTDPMNLFILLRTCGKSFRSRLTSDRGLKSRTTVTEQNHHLARPLGAFGQKSQGDVHKACWRPGASPPDWQPFSVSRS